MADGDPRQEQLNLRLSRANTDILEAVAFLERTKPAALVRRIVEEHLHDRLADEDVQLVLGIRKRKRALDSMPQRKPKPAARD